MTETPIPQNDSGAPNAAGLHLAARGLKQELLLKHATKLKCERKSQGDSDAEVPTSHRRYFANDGLLLRSDSRAGAMPASKRGSSSIWIRRSQAARPRDVWT